MGRVFFWPFSEGHQPLILGGINFDYATAVTVKRISILGSTGSIGTQTLDIVTHHPDAFQVVGLAAGSNVELLAQQVAEFRPEIVALRQENKLPSCSIVYQSCIR